MEAREPFSAAISPLLPLPERLSQSWDGELIWGHEETGDGYQKIMKSCRALYIDALSTDDIHHKLGFLAKLESLISKNHYLGLLLQERDKIALCLMLFSYGQMLLTDQQFKLALDLFSSLRHALWSIHPEELSQDDQENIQGLSIFTNYYLCLLSSLRPFRLKLCAEIEDQFSCLSPHRKQDVVAPYVLAKMVTTFSMIRLTSLELIANPALNVETILATVEADSGVRLGLLPMHVLPLTDILQCAQQEAPDVVCARLNESIETAKASLRPAVDEGWVEELLRLKVMQSFLRD